MAQQAVVGETTMLRVRAAATVLQVGRLRTQASVSIQSEEERVGRLPSWAGCGMTGP